jgi:hypothetical protein
VKDWTGEAIRFARHAIKAETETRAGQLNAIWMVLSLAVVVTAGLPDLLQAVVRIWEPTYTTGLPSGLALFGIWAGASLLCVLFVGLTSPEREHD